MFENQKDEVFDNSSKNIFALFENHREEHESSSGLAYLEVNHVRVEPKRVIFQNPFEGKIFKENIIIRNCGKKPVFIRILKPSSSGVKITTLKQGYFLCSGMFIRRTVTYKVQMVTLIKSCIIPIYINDDKLIDYQVKVFMTPVNLIIKPSTLLDFGHVDASFTPTRRKLTVINNDIKPTRFFIDLGPNRLGLSVDPNRGIIMGENEVELTVAVILSEEGEFNTEFWIICDVPTFIQIKAKVGLATIIPKFVPSTPSFSFIQFPITYYGSSAIRNVVMHNSGVAQSFFAVLGEVEMQTFTLKKLRKEVDDYNYFKISPEEGRLLANDVRVFQFTYSPVLKNKIPKPYHMVMMQIKRLNVREINPDDYPDGVFEERPSVTANNPRTSEYSNASNNFISDSDLHINSNTSNMEHKKNLIEVRLLLYGQVEEISVSFIPDSLTLRNLEVNETITRVLQIKNNCSTLPIMFRYKKKAFIEIEPKFAQINSLESLELKVLITPRSFDKIKTHIVFELLYYKNCDPNDDLVIIGQRRIPLLMDQKVCGIKKPINVKCHKEVVLAKDFDFRKPNQSPKLEVMKQLVKDNIYIGLPDDRPQCIRPDTFGRAFKSIYAAIPRYQPRFNEYALTPRDIEMKKIKNYYNIYIGMIARKRKPKAILPPPDAKQKCLLSRRFEVESEVFFTSEFIPLTPIQMAAIEIEPRSSVVENVAFDSTYEHTLQISNDSNCYLKIYLKGSAEEYAFVTGKRHTIAPNTVKSVTIILHISAEPMHNYDLDVIINNCFVVTTTILVKARPKHLTLSMEMLTFYENEPPSKFVELHNELNVDIPFTWKVPSVFRVDPINGEVVSGRFVACLISFEVGLAENMVYDLGIHTDNMYYNLKVLIEGTNYNVKIPPLLSFEKLSLNVPCYKTIPLTNMSAQRLSYEVLKESIPEGITIKPKGGFINAWSSVYLVACACFNKLGDFAYKIEVLIVHYKKIFCEITGKVIFPDLQFKPDVLRFRKMAASSFDITCVTVLNKSSAIALIQFDTDRFPEFNYSEFTNSEFMTSDDVIVVGPSEEKKFSIHFYPYNPLVSSFPLPIIINKTGVVSKSKTMLLSKLSIKIHAQVLSYKLEVKSWKYTFNYFPYYDVKTVTSHIIKVKNPAKTALTFCIRLDELQEPFSLSWVEGIRPTQYSCAMLVDLLPEEQVIFEANFIPSEPGTYTLRLPVYIRDDFTQDMHNYFYFVGTYPEACYKCNEESIHLGFVPLSFTISKNLIVDMAYHHPECNVAATVTDPHLRVDINRAKPKSISFYKVISIIFNSSKSYALNAKLLLYCDCPGHNFEIDIFGGCENNYFTVHSCIEYFKTSTTLSLDVFFDNDNDDKNINKSNLSLFDSDKEEETTQYNYKTDLPYFQSGTEPFDEYMKHILVLFEKWISEQVFFGSKSYTIPDTICIPDIKVFDKQTKRDSIIRVPLQEMLNYLVGSKIMENFEIKYNEKKPLWSLIRKFYISILNYLQNIGCFVHMVKPENLLTYAMYREYMKFIEKSNVALDYKMFYLLSKQSWLDIVMQAYKILISRRILQNLKSSTCSIKNLPTCRKSLSSSELESPRHGGISTSAVTILSEESIMLLMWVNKNFQDYKHRFQSKHSRSSVDLLNRKTIDNFDTDLSDSLGIIACVLSHCTFLEDYIKGIYSPANNRMERFNNAYILIKILSIMQISFTITPIEIIEPNIIQMIMFLTYLYDFLLPLKAMDMITFNAELPQTCEEKILICNESKHRIYYKIFFFQNADDLFSVKDKQIVIEAETVFRLTIKYYARFLRVQRTVLLLSGECSGYQFTNSKLYYLEGRPDLSKTGNGAIELSSTIYRISTVDFEVKSPYPVVATYDIYLLNEETPDMNTIEQSLIPYSKIQETNAMLRCTFPSAVAEANEAGLILMSATLCNIINTDAIQIVIFREKTIGDFIAKLNIKSTPMKKFDVVKLKIQKTLTNYPCTCHKKKPDVTNTKCPRNVKVTIPARNEHLWKAVMEFFLKKRDPEEKEFWKIYGGTPIGSRIVMRILYDHKKLLTGDMTYFMNKLFTYDIKTKQSESVVPQKRMVIEEKSTLNSTTEIMIHLNEVVKSFFLVLQSDDNKETRSFKVLVNYE